MAEEGEKVEVKVEQEGEENKENEPKPDLNCKVVLLGDDGCGKTSLALFYKNGKKPTGELPIISPCFQKDEEVDGQKVHVVIWDPACSENEKEMRIKSYHDTNIFLLCMALNDQKTCKNLIKVWAKEIFDYDEKANLVIVGTKSDSKVVQPQATDTVLRNVPHRAYCEVNSVNGAGIENLFHIKICVY